MEQNSVQKNYKKDDLKSIWKSNVPLLYDYCARDKIEWPCLSIDGYYNKERTCINVVYGTQTCDGEQNYICFGSFSKPLFRSELCPTITLKSKRFVIEGTIPFDSDVQKVRFNKKNRNVVACIGELGKVGIYDSQRQSLLQEIDIGLFGGYGLDWSSVNDKQLAVSTDSGTVFALKITDEKYNSHILMNTIKSNNNISVNDVAWSRFTENYLYFVQDDGKLCSFDVIKSKNSCLISESKSSSSQLFSVCADPNNEYLVATGGSQGIVEIWDMRCYGDPMMTLYHHTDSVYSVKWCESSAGLLASSSLDFSVKLFDLRLNGRFVNDEGITFEEEEAPSTLSTPSAPSTLSTLSTVHPNENNEKETVKDSECCVDSDDEIDDNMDNRSELLFTHRGHFGSVYDFFFVKGLEGLLCSAGMDNSIECWKPANSLFSKTYGIDTTIVDEVLEVFKKT